MTHAKGTTFGDLLRQRRLTAGLTQESLAERAGLSVHGIQKLERGVTRPYRDTVQRLLVALRLPLADEAELLAAAEPAPRPMPRHREPDEDAARHNLPVSVTSFIGRAEELAELRTRLTEARVLTLTGVGGCGKTRLALELVRAVMDDYSAGVWLVELGPLTDPDLVAITAARVVGVRETIGQSVTASLASALRTKRLLLVLDNCEHLLDTCAHLADTLVRSCPDLRILATSREPLGIAGEVAWRVPSLETPDPDQLPPLAQLERTPAVQLFVERAQAVEPHFALTDHNSAAVVEVCRKLDGIPLAIELAAACVSVLPVEQINIRLNEALRLLSRGSRLAPSRHRTLRAAIQWSYDLLSKSEQSVFNRLSVFAGGCGLEAAEAVCGGEDIQSDFVLELVGQLVDKSLVVAEADFGEARFRLLETLRQFGMEHLDKAELKRTHDRHAEFFLQLAEQAEPALWGPRLPMWLARLEREHDNMREALAWCMADSDAERGLRLGGALARFWLSRGYFTEGRSWLDRLLLLPEQPANVLGRAAATMGAALLADYQGDASAARALAEQAVARSRALGAERLLAMSLAPLTSALIYHEEFAAAKQAAEEGIRVSCAVGDKAIEALHAVNLGRCLHLDGQPAAARQLYEKALVLTQETGYVRMRIRALFLLGLLSHQDRDFAAARLHLDESLAVAREVDDRVEIARVLIALARLAVDEHDPTLATHCLRDASKIATDVGRGELLARCAAVFARLLAVQGRELEALQLIGCVDEWYRRRRTPPAPEIQPDLRFVAATAREKVGEAQAEASLARGRAMSVDRAIAAVMAVD